MCADEALMDVRPDAFGRTVSTVTRVGAHTHGVFSPLEIVELASPSVRRRIRYVHIWAFCRGMGSVMLERIWH